MTSKQASQEARYAAFAASPNYRCLEARDLTQRLEANHRFTGEWGDRRADIVTDRRVTGLCARLLRDD